MCVKKTKQNKIHFSGASISFLRRSIPPGLGNYCVSMIRLLRVGSSFREKMQLVSPGFHGAVVW